MKKYIFFLFTGILVSCSSTSSMSGDILRPGDNLPEAFEPSSGVDLDENSCKSPMLDPRDDSEITFIRSSGSTGDYEVAEGKYGVGKRELLRLDCQTGKVLGVVKK